MRFCLFVTFRPSEGSAAPLPAATIDRIVDEAAQRNSVVEVHAHRPVEAVDPFLDKAVAPPLVPQLYFDDPSGPEVYLSTAFLGLGGRLSLADLPGIEVSAQAMVVRRFARHPLGGIPPLEVADGHCSYLVAYPGEADDMEAWNRHYLGRHVPLMLRLPGLLDLEVYTRLDHVGTPRVKADRCMQRNRVMFETPGALTSALESPIRAEMRADFHALPHFAGGNVHFPMTTRVVRRNRPVDLDALSGA